MSVDSFIEWLDKENLMICPFMDQKESQCPHYKEEYKGYTGGYCLANIHGDDCSDFKGMDELGQPIDLAWKMEWKSKKESLKRLQFEKQFHKITEWCVR